MQTARGTRNPSTRFASSSAPFANSATYSHRKKIAHSDFCVGNVSVFLCWNKGKCNFLTSRSPHRTAFIHDAPVHLILIKRGGGLGSRPKKMYGERLGDGVEYHLMSPTPRR